MQVAFEEVEPRLFGLHARIVDRLARQTCHVPLAERCGAVTSFVPQYADKACMLGGESVSIGEDFGLSSVQPGKDRSARGRAKGMCPDVAESHALTGQPVQNRRGGGPALNLAILGMVVSRGAVFFDQFLDQTRLKVGHYVYADVICDHEQDIGAAR